MTNQNNYKYISAYNQLLKECDTIYHSAAVKAGISDCAFWILYTLQDKNHIYTQSEIGDNSSMPRQTVNSALKKLEKDGFLTLNKTSGKNSKSIHLTEKGTEFSDKYILPVMVAENKACMFFSKTEKENFITTFRALVDSLKKEIELIDKEAQNG